MLKKSKKTEELCQNPRINPIVQADSGPKEAIRKFLKFEGAMCGKKVQLL